jgi:hypothetical protein
VLHERINIKKTTGTQIAIEYGAGLSRSVKAPQSAFRFFRTGPQRVNIYIDSVLYFERDFAGVCVMREDKGESSYTQMTEVNYDELTDDINEAGGGGGAIKYLYWTEAEFEAAKDGIPLGATVVKMYEYPENGYSTGRPDLWPVDTEIDFGGGLYGQRFTGTITGSAYAGLNTELMPSGSVSRPVNSGGWWDSNRTATAGYQRYIAVGQGYAVYGGSGTTGHVFTCVVSVTEDFALNMHTVSSADRTNAPYDIWVTYTK